MINPFRGRDEFFSNERRAPFVVLRECSATSRIRDGKSRYRFAGEGVKAYADKLRDEMDRRRLRFTPIDWPATATDRRSQNRHAGSGSRVGGDQH